MVRLVNKIVPRHFDKLSTILRIAIFVIFMLPVSVIHAADVSLIYCDTPPAGEQYYTACIACSNLDGKPGDELVLTDDYGAFQILSFDVKNKEFIERWVSNPEFEIRRVKNIFLPPASSNEKAFMVFLTWPATSTSGVKIGMPQGNENPRIQPDRRTAKSG